jgi:hypothetical protein
MTDKRNFFTDPYDFSLALGGPLFQLFLRARLSGPALELLIRRIIVFTAITWLPLVLLTALSGDLVNGVQLPFVSALAIHTRLLVALPLLIGAELFVHEWSRNMVRQFLDRDLVAPEDRPRFDEIVASALRLRNSVAAELVLIVLAVAGHWAAESLALNVPAWYGARIDGRWQFTPAGYWTILVGLPLFRFFMLRWYFRIFLWYRFLWQTARLPLRLNTLHPDRAGGLGFLAESVFAFAPVLLAHTVVLSGEIGTRIWQGGAKLATFQLEIVAAILILGFIVLLPLTFFSSQLIYAKRTAIREYGSVASGYIREFRAKWIAGQNPEGERLLGTADIQSLADLGNSFEVVRETGVVPFGKKDVLSLAAMLAAPLLLLLPMVLPLREIVDRILAMIL